MKDRGTLSNHALTSDRNVIEQLAAQTLQSDWAQNGILTHIPADGALDHNHQVQLPTRPNENKHVNILKRMRITNLPSYICSEGRIVTLARTRKQAESTRANVNWYGVLACSIGKIIRSVARYL
jgi:hypothetical protein